MNRPILTPADQCEGGEEGRGFQGQFKSRRSSRMASNGAAARADSGSGLWEAAEEGIVLGRAGTTLLLEWVPGKSWVPRYVSCPYTLEVGRDQTSSYNQSSSLRSLISMLEIRRFLEWCLQSDYVEPHACFCQILV